jgi:hypothetical protein
MLVKNERDIYIYTILVEKGEDSSIFSSSLGMVTLFDIADSAHPGLSIAT